MKRPERGLAYGQVKKRSKGHRVERVAVRALYGKAPLKHVLALLGYKQMHICFTPQNLVEFWCVCTRPTTLGASWLIGSHAGPARITVPTAVC